MLKFIFSVLFISILFGGVARADALGEAVELCRSPDWVEGTTAEEVGTLLAEDTVVIFRNQKPNSWERHITVNDIIDDRPEPEFVDMWDTIYVAKEASGIVVFLVRFEGETFIHLNQPRTWNGKPGCFRTMHQIRDPKTPIS